MSEPRADFLVGLRDVAPAMPANIPFGVIVGVAAVGIGMSPVQAIAMSATVFAGAAQLAAIDLLGRDAPVVVVVLTALVVNLRYVMYSASIAPYFRRLSTKSKALIGYLLLDVNFALSITAFEADEEVDRRAYYFGTAVPIWITWVGSTAVGAYLGASVPAAWQLDFAVPLLFLALLVPNVEGRATGAAAAVSGVVAVLGANVPFNLGLIVAAMVGIVAGMIVDGRTR